MRSPLPPRSAVSALPLALIVLVAVTTGCTRPGNYPSLAPRAAETINPRVPIVVDPSPGTLDPRIASALAQAVTAARGGSGAFETLARRAEGLAAAAGPPQSESWVVAQQALSALGAQHGVTTGAASAIDALAADQIDKTRWINPATRAAIEAAAAEVGAINERETSTIKRLGARLGV